MSFLVFATIVAALVGLTALALDVVNHLLTTDRTKESIEHLRSIVRRDVLAITISWILLMVAYLIFRQDFDSEHPKALYGVLIIASVTFALRLRKLLNLYMRKDDEPSK